METRKDARVSVQFNQSFIYFPINLFFAILIPSREERKLRVFENMVLRRIFRPRRDEVTGEWRRLHNEELNDLYCSPDRKSVV
jgi:hypothetical protein